MDLTVGDIHYGWKNYKTRKIRSYNGERNKQLRFQGSSSHAT